MSKQINRNEIAEKGVLDNLLEPLKELLKVTDRVDAKLKDTAKTINESFKFSESSKGLRELEVNLKKTNKLAEQKKKVQQDQTKVQKQLASAQERLNSLSTEEAQDLIKTREAIRNKTSELKASGSAYKELSLQARNLKNESKDLGAQLLQLKQEGKENSQQYQELAQRYAETSQQAAKMDKDLKTLDKTVGDNFRNVGNYESAFDALNKEVAKGGMDFRDLRKRIQEYQSIAVKAGRTSPIGQKAIKEASKLQDEMDTLTQQTKALADDGANMKAALQLGEVVASSYQSVLAVQQLLGVESERILEVMAKIQAIQVVINNLNKIRNSLDKASILTIKAKMIANKAYNFVLGTQATVTTATTVATRALRIAMLALPIVAIIAGITALVGWLSRAGDESEKLKEQTDELTESLKEQRKELERKRDFRNQKINIRNNEEILEQQAKIIQKEMELDDLKANQPKNLKAIETAERSLAQERLNLLLKQQKQEKKQFDEKFNNLKEEYHLIEETNDEIISRIQQSGGEASEEQMQTIRENTQEMRKLQNQIILEDEERNILLKKQANERLEFDKNFTKQYLQNKKQEKKEDKDNSEERKMQLVSEEELLDEIYKKRSEKQNDELEKERLQLEASLDKQNRERELANIENAKTQEEFDEMELERQKKHLEDLIELRKLYGEDVSDLNVELARLNKQYNIENTEDLKQTVKQVGNAITNLYSDILRRQQDELAQQERNAAQLYGTLEKFAAEGNVQAQESLTEMLEMQQQAQREQIRLQQRQQRIEQARQVYSIIQSQLDAGKSPGEAIASTGGFMAQIQGLVQSLPSFYEGTEDTGKVGKALDSKGGRLSVLHNNERVLTADQNKHLQGIPNPMIPVLVNKALDSAGNSYDLLAVDELRKTRKAIENLPRTDYQVQKVLGEFSALISSSKKGNLKKVNRYD